jgi:Tol biopolymer transport system component
MKHHWQAKGMRRMMGCLLRLTFVLAVASAVLVVGTRAAGTLLPRSGVLSFVSDMNTRHWSDIYLMDVGHRIATNITRNPALEQNPVWSVNGWLAYAQAEGDNVVILVRDPVGTTHKIFTSYDSGIGLIMPAWAGDGRLAFVGTAPFDNPDVYIMEPDGQVHLASTSPAPNLGPAWSLNGRLAFDSWGGGHKIFILEPDGDVIDAVPEFDEADNAAWAFTNELTFTTPNGVGRVILKRQPNGSLQVLSDQFAGVNQLTWSTNNQLAFEANSLSPDQGTQIYILEPNGSFRAVPNPVLYSSVGNPVWSADGWLAYTYYFNGHSQIDVMSPDGQVHPVTAEMALGDFPSWLP